MTNSKQPIAPPLTYTIGRVHLPKIDPLFANSLVRIHQTLTKVIEQVPAIPSLKVPAIPPLQGLQVPVIPPEFQRALHELGKAFSDADKAQVALKAGWVSFPGMP